MSPRVARRFARNEYAQHLDDALSDNWHALRRMSDSNDLFAGHERAMALSMETTHSGWLKLDGDMKKRHAVTTLRGGEAKALRRRSP